eukprot:TRINITY_DN4315_c1_g4_i1.p3 TRINITY_DN4315_c1_g4~~TRINITY_DN4315_c1_g4_i1.p3  ORF type:complete len:194 (+),score=50.82 TRINITY_DN4315_c1_g4_i1:54-635(+)
MAAGGFVVRADARAMTAEDQERRRAELAKTIYTELLHDIGVEAGPPAFPFASGAPLTPAPPTVPPILPPPPHVPYIPPAAPDVRAMVAAGELPAVLRDMSPTRSCGALPRGDIPPPPLAGEAALAREAEKQKWQRRLERAARREREKLGQAQLVDNVLWPRGRLGRGAPQLPKAAAPPAARQSAAPARNVYHV